MNDPNLREHNTDAIFMVMDTDADGVITSDDLTALGTRICEQLHITGSPAAAPIVDGYAAWWEQLRADCDTDGDGRISRAEFAQAMLSGGGDPQAYYDQQMAKIISLVADVMDIDGDGFIEQDEYVALFRAVPEIDRQVVLAGFARLDANGDGRISREEFQAGVADLVLSTNQADPGSSLIG
jgi:Ca2+-binding EF-hand superfamily protein